MNPLARGRILAATVRLLLFAGAVYARAAERTESFDRDPGWDGHNNRSETPARRTIRQDFGNSQTSHTGAERGEIGGFITPAAEPAYYAKKIPEQTFADPLTASGTFTCPDGRFHLLLGFFHSRSMDAWRTPNTIALRLQGRGEKFYAFVEYASSRFRAGGDIPGGFTVVPDEERPGHMRLRGFRSGGALHRWSLTYDPNGHGGTGSITATIDDETSVCHLDPGHRADGAKFDRFGILTVMKQADTGGEAWIGDLTINGERQLLTEDPGWDAFQNRRTYETTVVRPRFDFGYSPTHFSGGKEKGEMGGLIFRGDGRYPQMMAYYGDRLESLSLERPLHAAGKISLRRGVTDSDVLLGFFHSQHSLESGGSDAIGLPPAFLGVNIGGPTREGFMLAPTYRLDKKETGSADGGPHILPDGSCHDWSFDYLPEETGGGQITATLDGQVARLKVPRERRLAGAHYNRFGLISTHTDGNGQHLYLDDLTYTWTQADLPAHRVLQGAMGSVLSLAYSPDGHLLATASRDKLVRIYDPQSGRLLQQLAGHTADVYSVAFSPDGGTLLSAGGDGAFRLWDVTKWELLRTIPAHDDIIRAAIFSPEGNTVASTGVDQSVRLWDARTWERRAVLLSHHARVKSLAFTPDGKLLASAGDDRLVCIWDVAAASLLTQWEAHDSSIETLVFSPDGKLLATSSNDHRVRLWATGTWALLHTLEGHREEVDSIAFSPDGRILASGCKDRTLKLWSPETGALLRTIGAHDDRIESLAFAPNGQLASGGGGKDFAVKLWEGLAGVPGPVQTSD